MTARVGQGRAEGRTLLAAVLEHPHTQANAAAYVQALLGPVAYRGKP
jgi:hypothetical protein